MREWAPPDSTDGLLPSGGKASANSSQQNGALPNARRLESLEVIFEANIGEQSPWVLMEMEESSPPAIEDATRLLAQLLHGTKLPKERLQPVERGLPCMFHGRIESGAGRKGKPATRAGRRDTSLLASEPGSATDNTAPGSAPAVSISARAIARRRLGE
jgi:hypothetical protein